MISYLRRITIHVWALPWILVSAFDFLVQHQRADDLAKRKAVVARFARRYLTIGEFIRAIPEIRSSKRLRNASRFFRTWEYQWMAIMLSALPRHWFSDVPDTELRQLLGFSTDALRAYREGGRTQLYLVKPLGRFGNIFVRQFRAIHLAFHHAAVAFAYFRAMTGDPAQNIENAVEFGKESIAICEQENTSLLHLYASGMRIALAKALIDYPAFRREEFVQEALTVLQPAKNCLAGFEQAVDMEMQNLGKMAKKHLGARCSFICRIARGAVYSQWTGNLDASLFGWLVPILIVLLNYQYAIALRRSGRLLDGILAADDGLRFNVYEADGLLASLEVEKGLCYLAGASGDLRSDVVCACKSFSQALSLTTKNNRLMSDGARAFVLAILGDAMAYLLLEERRDPRMSLSRVDIPKILAQLGLAARVAQEQGMLHALSEIRWTLGRIYAIRKEFRCSFLALVSASRLSRKLERRTRTQRMRRGEIEATFDKYALLLSVAVQYKDSLGSRDPRQAAILSTILRIAEYGRLYLLEMEISARDRIPAGATAFDLKTMFQLRREWHASELRLIDRASSTGASRSEIEVLKGRSKVKEREYLAELEMVRRNFDDPEYDPDYPIPSVGRRETLAVCGDLSQEVGTGILEYYVCENRIYYFVVVGNEVSVGSIAMTRSDLSELYNQWQNDQEMLRSNKIAWQQWERGRLLQTLERLREVAEIPTVELLRLAKKSDRTLANVLIVPHKELHVFPLHAIRLRDGRALGDLFALHYTPSIGILTRLLKHNRKEENTKATGLAVAYPASANANDPESSVLAFARDEAAIVQELTEGILLEGKAATLENVRKGAAEARYLHFACHGVFNPDDPLQSYLTIASNDSNGRQSALTLGEVLESFSLGKCEVVTLGACETGVTKIDRRGDEYIGMTMGFLYAGARTVVSALWMVPDIASWLLVQLLWEGIRAQPSAGNALRNAQSRLRTMKRSEVIERVSNAASRNENKPYRYAMLSARDSLSDEFPFSNPYWWAAFTINGLG